MSTKTSSQRVSTLLGAIVAITLFGTTSAVNASPISGNNDAWSVWSANTPGANSNSVSQQALPTAAAALTLVGAGLYTGVLNFTDTSANTIGGFLNSDNPAGVFGGCDATCQATVLSTPNFAHATLFRFDFTLASAATLSFAHDDGISLFVAGDFLNNLLPLSASAPTNVANYSVSVAAGTYSLWYSEVNGLPAALRTDVPEPTSLGLIGLGLLGLGALKRRRRKLGR